MHDYVKIYKQGSKDIDISGISIKEDGGPRQFSWNPMQIPTIQDSFFDVRSASVTLEGAYLAPKNSLK